jgi:hypothetical protein
VICVEQLTVRQVKKYLVQKNIIATPNDVEITCRGEILGNDHTLDFIKKTRWHATAIAADLASSPWQHQTQDIINDVSRVLILNYRLPKPLATVASAHTPLPS